MLEHLMEGTERKKVTLDDTENRRLAKNDPMLFLEMHPAPVLIDEVQYAPELFPFIKIMIDNGCGIITISQENQPTFFEKLIKFYETGDNTDLKQWIYDTSIDGIDLNNNEK